MLEYDKNLQIEDLYAYLGRIDASPVRIQQIRTLLGDSETATRTFTGESWSPEVTELLFDAMEDYIRANRDKTIMGGIVDQRQRFPQLFALMVFSAIEEIQTPEAERLAWREEYKRKEDARFTPGTPEYENYQELMRVANKNKLFMSQEEFKEMLDKTP